VTCRRGGRTVDCLLLIALSIIEAVIAEVWFEA
jgi:hypothetical protein